MENGPFEDVFPIKGGDIPASYVSLPEGTSKMLKPKGMNLPKGAFFWHRKEEDVPSNRGFAIFKHLGWSVAAVVVF